MAKKNKAKWLREIAFEALKILKDNDGQMSPSDLMVAVEESKGNIIPEESKGEYSNKTTKWETRLRFFSVLFVKVDFLRKESGIWYLSSKGSEAVEIGEDYVNDEINKLKLKLNKRKATTESGAQQSAEQGGDNDLDIDSDLINVVKDYESKSLDDDESKAYENIEEHVRKKLDWQDFQKLCAALLHGMGYHVRYVAPPGPDGGIDVVAYSDPIGAQTPRIKLQAKHSREGKIKVGINVLMELESKLTPGDIGIVATTSSFVSACRDYARREKNHIELIDMKRFIQLWRENYNNLPEEGKAMLPLRPIYFLDKKRIPEDSEE